MGGAGERGRARRDLATVSEQSHIAGDPVSGDPVLDPFSSTNAASSEPLDAARPTGGPAVLVVEDDAVLARLAVRVLEHAGFRASVAMDGAAALARLGDQDLPVDVVILDMTLPAGITGADVYEAVSGLRPGIPVVVSTGWSANDVDARVSGYAAFLQKPYRPDALVATVNRALGGSRSRADAGS